MQNNFIGRSVAFLRTFVTADISAEKCVHFLKQAQEDAFNTLKEKAKDDEWLEAFLNAGGLEVRNVFFTNR